MSTHAGRLHPTHIDLPEAARAQVVGLLRAALADVIDLHLRCKHAHWNVKGPGFKQFHELFDDVAEQSEEWMDEIAERCVTLGGIAPGLPQVVAEASRLPAAPHDPAPQTAHVRAVAFALSAFGKAARAGIDDADRAGDKDTADLFTQVSRACDKALWMVESHLVPDA